MATNLALTALVPLPGCTVATGELLLIGMRDGALLMTAAMSFFLFKAAVH